MQNQEKLSEKVIRLAFLTALDHALEDIGVSKPSKKTKKAIAKAVEKISLEVHHDLKKSIKKAKTEEAKKIKHNKKDKKIQAEKASKNKTKLE